jgi:hypothetical protein
VLVSVRPLLAVSYFLNCKIIGYDFEIRSARSSAISTETSWKGSYKVWQTMAHKIASEQTFFVGRARTRTHKHTSHLSQCKISDGPDDPTQGFPGLQTPKKRLTRGQKPYRRPILIQLPYIPARSVGSKRILDRLIPSIKYHVRSKINSSDLYGLNHQCRIERHPRKI